MLDFTRSREADFQDFGRWIWQQAEHFSTQEQLSQFIATALFEEFILNDGPQLALVRIFRLVHTDELPDNLLVRIPADEPLALALTGTCGIELDWCDRRLSKAHQIIPLSQAANSHTIPLFPEMLAQFGVTVDDLRRDGTYRSEHLRGRFFVPNTANSPLICTQSDFVRPYSIQAEIGFGGYLRGIADRQSLYFLVAFARVPISPDAALRFFTMQDYIGTVLANHSHFSPAFDL